MDFIKKPLISAAFLLIWVQPTLATSPSVATGGDNHFAMLSAAELDYYEKSFSYAMAALENSQVYEWRTATSEGQVRPGKQFTSKSNAICRSFSETYMIHSVKGQHSGFGCQRDGGNSWCKLKEGNMLSCALEAQDNVIDRIIDKTNTVESKGKNYKRQTESTFWDWWPF